MKVEMIATKRMKYGTRMLNAGEPFEAKQSDVRLLEAIRKAKRIEAPAVEAAPVPEPVAVEAPPAPARARRGRRRANTEDAFEAPRADGQE